MALPPNIPRDTANPRFGHEVSDTLTRLHQQVQQQAVVIAELREEMAAAGQAAPATSADDLGATGFDPLNLESLAGQAAQPQKAYLPLYAATPTGLYGKDPNLQAGAAHIVGTTLYRVNDNEQGATAIGGAGTVTSVASTAAFPLVVSGTPITTTGTLAYSFFKSPRMLYGLNVTPTTVAAATTADQNLQSFGIGIGDWNLFTRTIHVWGAGVFSTDAGLTPTLTFKLKLGGVTLVTFTSGVADAGKANGPWNFDVWFTVTTAGASGEVEAHGRLQIDLTTTFLRGYADTNTAVVGTIDFTGALTLQATVAFNSSDVDNSCTMRHMVIEYS